MHPDLEEGARAGALAMAGALGALGGLFALAPGAGARLFGLPAPREARPYVRALAFRDFGCALALAAASRGPLRSLSLLAVSLAAIPAADAALVARLRGGRAAPQIGLHAVSGVALLGLAAASWLGQPLRWPGRRLPR